MKPKVYLAGGFHTGWDDRAEELLPSWECLKPKTHGLTDPKLYTPMDMGLIENSTAVLAKFEYFNGVTFANLSFELGYARRAGKFIVVIMDADVLEHFKERYFGMPLAAADATCMTVEGGCLALNNSYFGAPDTITYPPAPVTFGPRNQEQPFQVVHTKEEREANRGARAMVQVVEGWIVDFFGEQPIDFDPEGVVQGSDETGFPDMVWGRYEFYEVALKTAAAIAREEGVLFDDVTWRTLIDKAIELDNVPYQTPGPRYVCIRRVGV